MRAIICSFFFSTLLIAVNAEASCVHTSYAENDGSVSEMTFPVTEDVAENLTTLGYQTVTCKKKYSIDKINQKCNKMQNWPDKMKDIFITRFKISAAKMCQYSREYVNSQN